jgi:hypothetical protein
LEVSMTIRNVMLLVTGAYFVVAFVVMPDGCSGYLGDPPDVACIDPTGVGQTVSLAAHLLFAGLAMLSVALIDHRRLVDRSTD